MSNPNSELGFANPFLQAILGGLVSWTAGQSPSSTHVPESPSIFVLRNNDLGDCLVITPMFEALRKAFPKGRITVGVGNWCKPCLANNPYIDEVLPVNAPWYNRFIEDRSIKAALDYIYTSQESRALAEGNFDIGIDVLGSYFGALLLSKARIPLRIGVEGYAGGHTGMHKRVPFNPYEPVGRTALRLVEELAPVKLPAIRPQIFLSPEESAMSFWKYPRERRIVIGPGAGLPDKVWPLDHFRELIHGLVASSDVEIILVGGPQDSMATKQLTVSQAVRSMAGELTLRETFSLVSQAGLVLCNSSMLMHAAAAFSIPTIVLLADPASNAREHQMLWGYPDTCITLGKDDTHSGIYSPGEVLKLALQSLAAP